MGRWKIGSFTAALGCIALGIIIALVQYDVVTYAVLGYLWPVLLILFGLEMLLRLFIKSDVKNRVSGWAVLLIILLVGASAAQSQLSDGSISQLVGNSHLVPVSGTLEIQDNIKTVKVSLPSGKVRIEGKEESTLSYEGALILTGSSQGDAESLLLSRWKVKTEGNTLILKLQEETNWFDNIQFGFNNKSPYLNINVPNNLAVVIETSNGSVEAWNLQSGIEAETSNGAINIHDIVGGVEVNTSNASMTIKNVQGEVNLDSSNGAITLDNIDGALSAESSNGKITVNSAVTGNWDFSSSNGKIVLSVPTATDAKITADTSNGSFKGNVSWDLKDDDSGTAVLGSGKHTVELSTSNGSVTVDTVE